MHQSSKRALDNSRDVYLGLINVPGPGLLHMLQYSLYNRRLPHGVYQRFYTVYSYA